MILNETMKIYFHCARMKRNKKFFQLFLVRVVEAEEAKENLFILWINTLMNKIDETE